MRALRPAGLEGLRLHPRGMDARLDLGGLIGLVEHETGRCLNLVTTGRGAGLLYGLAERIHPPVIHNPSPPVIPEAEPRPRAGARLSGTLCSEFKLTFRERCSPGSHRPVRDRLCADDGWGQASWGLARPCGPPRPSARRTRGAACSRRASAAASAAAAPRPSPPAHGRAAWRPPARPWHPRRRGRRARRPHHCAGRRPPAPAPGPACPLAAFAGGAGGSIMPAPAALGCTSTTSAFWASALDPKNGGSGPRRTPDRAVARLAQAWDRQPRASQVRQVRAGRFPALPGGRARPGTTAHPFAAAQAAGAAATAPPEPMAGRSAPGPDAGGPGQARARARPASASSTGGASSALSASRRVSPDMTPFGAVGRRGRSSLLPGHRSIVPRGSCGSMPGSIPGFRPSDRAYSYRTCSVVTRAAVPADRPVAKAGHHSTTARPRIFPADPSSLAPEPAGRARDDAALRLTSWWGAAPLPGAEAAAASPCFRQDG